MTTDTELCERLVELGILVAVRRIWHPVYSFSSRWVGPLWNAEQAVRDWRVAGAVMERMSRVDLINAFVPIKKNGQAAFRHLDKLRDPRAIIEAGKEALSNDN